MKDKRPLIEIDWVALVIITLIIMGTLPQVIASIKQC